MVQTFELLTRIEETPISRISMTSDAHLLFVHDLVVLDVLGLNDSSEKTRRMQPRKAGGFKTSIAIPTCETKVHN